MAITRVQEAVGNTATGTSVTQSWTTTPTANNLLVAIGFGTKSISNASISGWTLAVSATHYTITPSDFGIWYKVAGASEGDVTLTWATSTLTQLVIIEWSGVGTLDKTAYTNDTTSMVTSRSTGTTATTAYNDELCIAAVATGNVTTAQSWSNSFTNEYHVDTMRAYMGSLVVSTTGTYESTMSWTTSRYAAGCIATFYSSALQVNISPDNSAYMKTGVRIR